VFDFCCALLGALGYFLLFDFLQNSLAIPLWLVRIQLTANLLYGLFGIHLFISHREAWLGRLAIMNLVYALFCLGVALVLFRSEILAASAFLLVEGLLIGGLAKFEWNAIRARR